MTFRQANAFVKRWRPVICPEWTVTVINSASPGLVPERHLASMEPAGDGDYLRAKLYLHEITSGKDREACERTLLHELLHLTLNDLERAGQEAAKGLSYDAQKLAEETINHQLERTVDRLADAFLDAPR